MFYYGIVRKCICILSLQSFLSFGHPFLVLLKVFFILCIKDSSAYENAAYFLIPDDLLLKFLFREFDVFLARCHQIRKKRIYLISLHDRRSIDVQHINTTSYRITIYNMIFVLWNIFGSKNVLSPHSIKIIQFEKVWQKENSAITLLFVSSNVNCNNLVVISVR